MEFRMGRTCVEGEGDSVHHGHEHHGNSIVVDRLHKLGLSAQEKVALMGSHTLGFIGESKKGHMSRWCMNPYVFDNTYFQDLLLGESAKYAKTAADLQLIKDVETRRWVETYAEDQNLFFTHYAGVHTKLSEMGMENLLVSELDGTNIIDGGYQEPSRYAFITKWLRSEESNQLEAADAVKVIEGPREPVVAHNDHHHH